MLANPVKFSEAGILLDERGENFEKWDENVKATVNSKSQGISKFLLSDFAGKVTGVKIKKALLE